MRILLTGATGQLGLYILRRLRNDDHAVYAWNFQASSEVFGVRPIPVALENADLVVESFRSIHPDVVIHAAAVSTVAECHRNPRRARQVNTDATALIAELCSNDMVRLIYTSTDLVFDGESGNYRETDKPNPLSTYGESKRMAERHVLTVANAVVVRLSLMFGPTLGPRPSFFDLQVTALRQQQPITLFADEWRSPLSLDTAAEAVITLAHSELDGLLHLGGPERLSRLEMGRGLADFLGVDETSIVETNRCSVTSSEPRPRDTSLDSDLWRSHFPTIESPTYRAALDRLFRICGS